jgi:ABC-type multidrug transport system ATPase subunit
MHAGILIDGKLACVGPPKALAARFGGYHVFTLTVPENQVSLVQAFVLHMCPSSQRTYKVAGTTRWQMPAKDIKLSKVFETMRSTSMQDLTVLDWGVRSASLEDVFINLANAVSKKGATVVQMC